MASSQRYVFVFVRFSVDESLRQLNIFSIANGSRYISCAERLFNNPEFDEAISKNVSLELLSYENQKLGF